MARPSQPLITSALNKRGVRIDILYAEKTYVILYKNKPFGIRDNNTTRKYLRSAFTNLAHAFNRADELNEIFVTKDFTVAVAEGYTPVERPLDSATNKILNQLRRERKKEMAEQAAEEPTELNFEDEDES